MRNVQTCRQMNRPTRQTCEEFGTWPAKSRSNCHESQNNNQTFSRSRDPKIERIRHDPVNPTTKNGTRNGTGQKTSTTSLDTRQNARQAKRDTRRASYAVIARNTPNHETVTKIEKPKKNRRRKIDKNTDCAGRVPRPAALAPKHIRELLWHLKGHPITSPSLSGTLAQPRGTRPAQCAGRVPRPAALAPKHLRELLWHLIGHPITSPSLSGTLRLAQPRGTRPAQCAGRVPRPAALDPKHLPLPRQSSENLEVVPRIWEVEGPGGPR